MLNNKQRNRYLHQTTGNLLGCEKQQRYISVPVTFTSGTTIVSADVNTNFSTLYTDYTAKFDPSTGHGHTGAGTDGPGLSAAVITAGTLAVARGGTGLASYAIGDIPYASAATTISKLAAVAAGSYLRSAGVTTAPVWSTLTLPNAAAISTILYASAADVISALATANSGVLVTSGTGVPSIATDIPTAVTVGGQYNYRVGGTDVSVADGGTGISSGTSGGVPYFSASTTIASSGALSANQVVMGGGAGAAPVSAGAMTNGQLLIGSTGVAPAVASLTAGSGISVTPGAGTITIAATGGSGITTVGNVTTGSVAFDGTIGTTLTSTTAGFSLLATNNTSGVGGNVSLTGGATTNATSAGGSASLVGGAGNTSGNGGAGLVTGGAPGATGTGGAVTITSGAGGATSGDSGLVTIQAGVPVDGNAGGVTILGRNGVGTNRTGGAITVTGGNGTGIGNAGAVTITAGAAGSGGNDPGATALLKGGAGDGSGNGGDSNLTGGTAGATGAGGQINLQGGTGGATSGAGGDIDITAGSGAGGNSVGGSVNASAGAGFGSSAGGTATWQGGTGGATGAGGALTLVSGSAGATGPAAGGAASLAAGTSKGTNQAGADLTLKAGQGTGTGAGGDIIFQVAPAGGSGSSNNARITTMTIQDTDTVEIGDTGLGANKLGILADDNTTAVVIKFAATQANVTASDTFIDFKSTTGSEATIAGTATGGVIAYNTFTGSHYTCVCGDLTGLEPGTLLEMISGTIEKTDWVGQTYQENGLETYLDGNGESQTRKVLVTKTYNATPKEQLFKTQICKTKGSKAAVGVWGGKDKEGRDMCLSIGTGFVFVANTGVAVAMGDYLISSATPGCVELQADDIYRNITVAKATEPIIWGVGEKSRKISCVYLGG